MTALEVVDLRYPLTDYQPEAAMIAMAYCVATMANVEPPTFDVTFERASNRYLVTSA